MIKNRNSAILVAYSENRVIGAQGEIPWKLPSERNRFKEICNGKKVIMGRKTFEEIGKPLSYCTILVVSKTLSKVPSGCLLCNSLEDALSLCNHDEEILIAGGQEIYEQILPYCKKIYATEIHKYIEGDRFFPKLPEHPHHQWIKETELVRTENELEYSYVTWTLK